MDDVDFTDSSEENESLISPSTVPVSKARMAMNERFERIMQRRRDPVGAPNNGQGEAAPAVTSQGSGSSTVEAGNIARGLKNVEASELELLKKKGSSEKRFLAKRKESLEQWRLGAEVEVKEYNAAVERDLAEQRKTLTAEAKRNEERSKTLAQAEALNEKARKTLAAGAKRNEERSNTLAQAEELNEKARKTLVEELKRNEERSKTLAQAEGLNEKARKILAAEAKRNEERYNALAEAEGLNEKGRNKLVEDLMWNEERSNTLAQAAGLNEKAKNILVEQKAKLESQARVCKERLQKEVERLEKQKADLEAREAKLFQFAGNVNALLKKQASEVADNMDLFSSWFQNDDREEAHGRTTAEPKPGSEAVVNPDRYAEDDSRTLFIGGLSWEVGEADLRAYFNKYGPIESVTVITEPGSTTGSAFIVFPDGGTVDKVLAHPGYHINGKRVDPKKVKARPGQVCVGGLPLAVSDEEIKAYFTQFGNVLEVKTPIEETTNRRYGYSFVTFEQEQVAHELINSATQTIGGSEVDVKKVQPDQKVSGTGLVGVVGGPGSGRGGGTYGSAYPTYGAGVYDGGAYGSGYPTFRAGGYYYFGYGGYRA